jgi:fatty acid desaturase
MYALLVGNFSLYFLLDAPLPLVVHMLISMVAIHLAFTIWHDAAHGSILRSPQGNAIIGVLAMFPYMSPFFMQKWIHMEHHRALNEKDDPNLIYLDGSFLTVPFRYLRALRYAKEVVTSDVRTPGEKRSDTVMTGLVIGIYAVAFVTGFGFDLLALWFVPFMGAKLLMDWYINYLPHIGLPADRYAGTRVVDANWLTPILLGHNYHAIHHLWPGVPWHAYRRIFREQRADLIEKGVPVEQSPFGFRPSGTS